MAKNGDADGFSRNLELAMQRLNLSKVELAHRMGVDKSVVRRWVLGGAKPSDANLSALTDLVAREIKGFTRAHWQADPERVAVLLELAPDQPVAPVGIAALLPHFGARAAAGLAQGLARYAGLYVQFYVPLAPAPARPLFCGGVRIAERDGMLWYSVSDGPRGVWTGGGPAFSVDGKMWVLIEEYRGRGDLCAIVYHGTVGPEAQIVDGLALARALNAGGVPVSGRFTLVRLDDLAAEAEQAEALYHAICGRAGELSMGDLAATLPGWLAETLRGDAKPWADRHQPYVLALPESDNLTIDAVDMDLGGMVNDPRRRIRDTVHTLFADALAAAEA